MRPSEKGDWIRAYLKEHGIAMPYSEIAKAGKVAGHGVLSKSYVSRVRLDMQGKTAKKKGKRKSNGHSKQPITELPPRERITELMNARGQNGEGTAGGQFLRALRVIGTDRGRKLLEIFEAGGA